MVVVLFNVNSELSGVSQFSHGGGGVEEKWPNY